MSKDDIQQTNVADNKPVTVDDVRRAIIGDENKLILSEISNRKLNCFIIFFFNFFSQLMHS